MVNEMRVNDAVVGVKWEMSDTLLLAHSHSITYIAYTLLCDMCSKMNVQEGKKSWMAPK